jgi:hypothetical protein
MRSREQFEPTTDRGTSMFGSKKKQGPPQRPFAHRDDCPMAKINPRVADEWQLIETGHWRRECQCGAEDWRTAGDGGVRQDPYNPGAWPTLNHLGGCEFRDATNPAILRAILKVTDVGDFYRVDCRSCEALWRVMYHAEGTE